MPTLEKTEKVVSIIAEVATIVGVGLLVWQTMIIAGQTKVAVEQSKLAVAQYESSVKGDFATTLPKILSRP